MSSGCDWCSSLSIFLCHYGNPGMNWSGQTCRGSNTPPGRISSALAAAPNMGLPSLSRLNKASHFLLHQKVHQGEWQLHTDRLRRYGVSITKQNQNFLSQRPQPTVSLYFSEVQHRITPEESLDYSCKAGHQAGCSSSWGCVRWTAKTISSNKSSWSLYQCNGRHLPNGPAF